MHLYFSNIKQRKGHRSSRMDLGSLLIRTKWQYQAKLAGGILGADQVTSKNKPGY